MTQEEFQKLQKGGLVSPINSEWVSLPHLVEKENGSYGCCGDYPTLNRITKLDCYPVLNLQPFSTKLAKKNPFYKVSLFSNYKQIKTLSDDIRKTTVTFPLGLYEYNYIQFWIFLRFMDKIFDNVICVFIYIDDILTFSENEQSHMLLSAS